MHDPTNSRYRYLAFKSSNSYRRFVKEDDLLKKGEILTEEQEIPAHGTYGGMLFDKRWKAKRLEILDRDDNACVICKGGLQLQVHHRQYHFIVNQNQFKPPWDYPNHLMITLCESCHKRGHNKFKVPTINI